MPNDAATYGAAQEDMDETEAKRCHGGQPPKQLAAHLARLPPGARAALCRGISSVRQTCSIRSASREWLWPASLGVRRLAARCCNLPARAWRSFPGATGVVIQPGCWDKRRHLGYADISSRLQQLVEGLPDRVEGIALQRPATCDSFPPPADGDSSSAAAEQPAAAAAADPAPVGAQQPAAAAHDLQDLLQMLATGADPAAAGHGAAAAAATAAAAQAGGFATSGLSQRSTARTKRLEASDLDGFAAKLLQHPCARRLATLDLQVGSRAQAARRLEHPVWQMGAVAAGPVKVLAWCWTTRSMGPAVLGASS